MIREGHGMGRTARRSKGRGAADRRDRRGGGGTLVASVALLVASGGGTAYENTAYTEDDLARALLSRQVMLQGTFVRAQ